MPLFHQSPVYSRVADAATNTTTDAFIAEHYTTGTPAAGYGVGDKFRGPNASGGAAVDMGLSAFVWTTATAGSEATAWALSLRRAGNVLTEQYRLSSTAFQMVFGGGSYLGLGGVIEVTAAGAGATAVQYMRATSSTGASSYTAQNDGGGSGDQVSMTIWGSSYPGTYANLNIANLARVGSSGTNIPLLLSTHGSQAITIATTATARWQVSSSGHLLAFLDNTYDIGASAATRPRTVYAATSFISSGDGSLAGALLSRLTSGALVLRGNRPAAATSNDVEITSTNTRTAGQILQLINTGAGTPVVWNADFRGINGGIKGADVASATTITLTGQSQDVTGSTTINHITTTDVPIGSFILLKFEGNITVTHNAGAPPANTAPIILSGAANFNATADDVLLLWWDGTNFREVARTVV